jgi:hypothetical protein
MEIDSGCTIEPFETEQTEETETSPLLSRLPPVQSIPARRARMLKAPKQQNPKPETRSPRRNQVVSDFGFLISDFGFLISDLGFLMTRLQP